jgi:hypothetical protein
MPGTRRGAPPTETGRLRIAHSAGGDEDIVTVKLQQLRDHYGYLTRAELGEPVPHGWWTCPGEFDARGRLAGHCAECAS